MADKQFFEKKGPFPLIEIVKSIGCIDKFNNEKNVSDDAIGVSNYHFCILEFKRFNLD